MPAWEANLNENNTDSLGHKFGLHVLHSDIRKDATN